MNQVQTNMVIFSLNDSIPMDTEQITAILEREYNIRMGPRNRRTFRAVTHYWITPERVDTVLNAMREVLELAREAA